MSSKNRFAAMIGKASDSPELKTWLAELKASPPRLKKGDTSAYVTLPKLGLELVFGDEAFETGRADLAIGEGALLLTAVMFKSSHVPDFSEYSGPLPMGLAFGQTPAKVHETMGPPERAHPVLPTERWAFEGARLIVTYDKQKTAVRQVSVERPRPDRKK
jgi:hypothetical protein